MPPSRKPAIKRASKLSRKPGSSKSLGPSPLNHLSPVSRLRSSESLASASVSFYGSNDLKRKSAQDQQQHSNQQPPVTDILENNNKRNFPNLPSENIIDQSNNRPLPPASNLIYSETKRRNQVSFAKENDEQRTPKSNVNTNNGIDKSNTTLRTPPQNAKRSNRTHRLEPLSSPSSSLPKSSPESLAPLSFDNDEPRISWDVTTRNPGDQPETTSYNSSQDSGYYIDRKSRQGIGGGDSKHRDNSDNNDRNSINVNDNTRSRNLLENMNIRDPEAELLAKFDTFASTRSIGLAHRPTVKSTLGIDKGSGLGFGFVGKNPPSTCPQPHHGSNRIFNSSESTGSSISSSSGSNNGGSPGKRLLSRGSPRKFDTPSLPVVDDDYAQNENDNHENTHEDSGKYSSGRKRARRSESDAVLYKTPTKLGTVSHIERMQKLCSPTFLRRAVESDSRRRQTIGTGSSHNGDHVMENSNLEGHELSTLGRPSLLQRASTSASVPQLPSFRRSLKRYSTATPSKVQLLLNLADSVSVSNSSNSVEKKKENEGTGIDFKLDTSSESGSEKGMNIGPISNFGISAINIDNSESFSSQQLSLSVSKSSPNSQLLTPTKLPQNHRPSSSQSTSTEIKMKSHHSSNNKENSQLQSIPSAFPKLNDSNTSSSAPNNSDYDFGSSDEEVFEQLEKELEIAALTPNPKHTSRVPKTLSAGPFAATEIKQPTNNPESNKPLSISQPATVKLPSSSSATNPNPNTTSNQDTKSTSDEQKNQNTHVNQDDSDSDFDIDLDDETIAQEINKFFNDPRSQPINDTRSNTTFAVTKTPTRQNTSVEQSSSPQPPSARTAYRTSHENSITLEQNPRVLSQSDIVKDNTNKITSSPSTTLDFRNIPTTRSRGTTQEAPVIKSVIKNPNLRRLAVMSVSNNLRYETTNQRGKKIMNNQCEIQAMDAFGSTVTVILRDQWLECIPSTDDIIHVIKTTETNKYPRSLSRIPSSTRTSINSPNLASTTNSLASINSVSTTHDDSESKEKFIVDKNDNLIIVCPDVLITCTSVAGSFHCQRKIVLSDRVRLPRTICTLPMLYGSIIHNLFQSCLTKSDFTTEFMATETEKLTLDFIEDIVLCDTTREEAIDYIHGKFENIQKWGSTYVGPYPKPQASVFTQGSRAKSVISLKKVMDVEEIVFAPSLGLKGIVDVTGNVVVNDAMSTKEYLVPIELKTSKSIRNVSHLAQTYLYSILLAEKYWLSPEISFGLLVYSETGETTQLPWSDQEIRGLLVGRNRLAMGMKNREQPLPELIDNQHMCATCEYFAPCVVYNKVLENGTEQDFDVNLQYQYREIASLIGPAEAEFFSVWNSLLAKEEGEMAGHLKELWTLQGKEREELGR